jgi:dihydrodipicolinate synthase/N-acetylneuraminate lyase
VEALVIFANWLWGDGYQEGADGAHQVASLFVPETALDWTQALVTSAEVEKAKAIWQHRP